MGKRNQGFSLIEVLVTVLIVAIGLMGLVAMQVVSAKNVNNSELRSLATYFVYDMSERMRANPTGVAAGLYDNINGTESDPGNNCSSACSAAVLAQHDAFSWNDSINNPVVHNTARGLGPGAVGTVTGVAGVYTISVQWSEQDRDNSGGVPTQQNLSIQFRF